VGLAIKNKACLITTQLTSKKTGCDQEGFFLAFLREVIVVYKQNPRQLQAAGEKRQLKKCNLESNQNKGAVPSCLRGFHFAVENYFDKQKFTNHYWCSCCS